MTGYRDPDDPSGFTNLYDAVGPTWFVLILIAGVAWFVGDLWLMEKLDWPDGYGFHCSGRGCFIDDMWHSPALLHHHSGYEVALFVCIWAPAAAIIGPFAYRGLRKLRGTKFSMYSDAE
jgi:hypothetical protein